MQKFVTDFELRVQAFNQNVKEIVATERNLILNARNSLPLHNSIDQQYLHNEYYIYILTFYFYLHIYIYIYLHI